LDCPLILQEFENNLKEKEQFEQLKEKTQYYITNDFKIEKIIGASKLFKTDKIVFLVKFKLNKQNKIILNNDPQQLVLAEYANLKWPDQIIYFYQKHLIFKN